MNFLLTRQNRPARPLQLGMVCLSLLSLGLVACQPKQLNQVAQQQGFVCKSLIEGFLKTQHLGQYELRSIAPSLHETAAQRTYVYQSASDNSVRLNMPTQPHLKFSCHQANDQYVLKLVNEFQQDDAVLMSLQVPSKDSINQMTAYRQENR
ncbi:hypothetical protein EC844_11672 [Acinetobacter calcoaceticus]|uniref:Lipoprotein n=1 Tax=Acinetobacter calcoaceticus TaxID=471 RepID=A0A4R1XNT1_ACICA|nr:hypothetical protein EC844_11672 [Acinetobacter calcoaceticus]